MPKLISKVHRHKCDATTDVAHVDEEPDESNGFPLTVDLSSCIGSDARCRVWVCPRHSRRVRWLAARVRRASGIRGTFVMATGGDLLPPDEPLRLLRCTDKLRIARVEHDWQHPFSFPDPDEDTPDPEPTPSMIKPAAQTVQQSMPAPPSRAPRSTASTEDDVMRTITPPPPPQHSDETLQRVKRRALALLNQVAGEDGPEREGEMPEREGADDVDAPKKRRRRVRRRRPARPVSPLEPPPTVEPSPARTSSPHPNTKTELTVVTSPVTLSLRPPSPEPPSQSLMRSSSVPAAVFLACVSPAPVLRTSSSSRAPRVVRPLSAGPTDLIVPADVTVGAP